MWILSQDKSVLIFSKLFFLSEEIITTIDENENCANNRYFIKTETELDYAKLGTYESEERAKEILLDIVKNIRQNINFTTKDDDKMIGSCFVYEMPQK